MELISGLRGVHFRGHLSRRGLHFRRGLYFRRGPYVRRGSHFRTDPISGEVLLQERFSFQERPQLDVVFPNTLPRLFILELFGFG